MTSAVVIQSAYLNLLNNLPRSLLLERHALSPITNATLECLQALLPLRLGYYLWAWCFEQPGRQHKAYWSPPPLDAMCWQRLTTGVSLHRR